MAPVSAWMLGPQVAMPASPLGRHSMAQLLELAMMGGPWCQNMPKYRKTIGKLWFNGI